MQILVVIVNYFTEHLVYEQVRPFRDEQVDFVVVDNGSRSGEVLKALDALPNVLVLKTDKNIGYLNGGFFGLRSYVVARGMPSWLIVSNPDISFNSSFFEGVRSIDPLEVAVVAPSIRSGRTGLDQNPFMVQRPSRRRLETLERLHGAPFLANSYRLAKEVYERVRPPMRRRETLENESVYAAHGSCMVLSSTFLKQLSDFNYPAFLYCEELFLAEEARRMALPVVYHPELELKHSEHQTTGLIRSRALVEHHRNALRFCLQTYW